MINKLQHVKQQLKTVMPVDYNDIESYIESYIGWNIFDTTGLFDDDKFAQAFADSLLLKLDVDPSTNLWNECRDNYIHKGRYIAASIKPLI